MAQHTTGAALAAGASILLALPAAAQESLVQATIEAATLKLGVATPVPVDCGPGGCAASDLDFVRLVGAADQEGIFYRAQAEGYFGNPVGPDDVVLQMKGLLRQEVASTRDSRFVTRLELSQTVTWTWTAREAVAFWDHEYRFDGEIHNTLAPGTDGSVVVEALGTTFFNLEPGPLGACTPGPVPGACHMPFIPGELDGEPVDQTLVLRLTATLHAFGGSPASSLQWADYTHTLALRSVTPYGADGKPLAGPWALYANGLLAFSAPVPEPSSVLLALLGLAGLGWHRRRR